MKVQQLVIFTNLVVLTTCKISGDGACMIPSGVRRCCTSFYRRGDKCIPCMGTIGINCSRPCPTGWYGLQCTSRCLCQADQRCDVFQGCMYTIAHPLVMPQIRQETTPRPTIQTTSPEGTPNATTSALQTDTNPTPIEVIQSKVTKSTGFQKILVNWIRNNYWIIIVVVCFLVLLSTVACGRKCYLSMKTKDTNLQNYILGHRNNPQGTFTNVDREIIYSTTEETDNAYATCQDYMLPCAEQNNNTNFSESNVYSDINSQCAQPYHSLDVTCSHIYSDIKPPSLQQHNNIRVYSVLNPLLGEQNNFSCSHGYSTVNPPYAELDNDVTTYVYNDLNSVSREHDNNGSVTVNQDYIDMNLPTSELGNTLNHDYIDIN